MKMQETLSRYFGIKEGTFIDKDLAIVKLVKITRLSFDFFENYQIQEMLGDDVPLQSDLFRFNFSGYILDKSSFVLEQIMESPTASILSGLPLVRKLINEGDLQVQTNKEVVHYIKNEYVPSIEDLLKTSRREGQVVNYLSPFEVRNAANFMSDAYLDDSLKEDQLRNKIETIKNRFKKE
jgi:hypothetical protein